MELLQVNVEGRCREIKEGGEGDHDRRLRQGINRACLIIAKGLNTFEIEFEVLTLALIMSDTGKYPFLNFKIGSLILIPCHSAASG